MPVYYLPHQWTAKPRIQELIRKPDTLPNFDHVVVTISSDIRGKFYNLITHNYIFPTWNKTVKIKAKLTKIFLCQLYKRKTMTDFDTGSEMTAWDISGPAGKLNEEAGNGMTTLDAIMTNEGSLRQFFFDSIEIHVPVSTLILMVEMTALFLLMKTCL